MKKILYFVAIAMTVLVASCKKESVNAPEAGENQFVATIDKGVAQNAPRVNDGMGTMTRLDGMNVYWNSGDQITVNGVTCTTSTSGSQVLFTAASAITAQATGSAHEAYYGCTAGTLPATQVFDINDTKFPMYAASNDKNLVFHNICGLIKVTIPAEINATSVEVTADQQLNGSFAIATADDKPYANMNAATVTDDMKKITVTPKQGTTFATGSEVYVAVPQGTYTNMTIVVRYGTAATDTVKRTKASFTVDVNRIYGVLFGGRTLLPYQFSVSPTKKVWFTKGSLAGTSPNYYIDDQLSASTNTRAWTNCDGWTVDGTSGLRMLTNDEWLYLTGSQTEQAGSRPNATNLSKRKVTIGTITDYVVIAPDNYTEQIKSTYTVDEFNASGLVCLRYTYTSTTNGKNSCCYWTSTAGSSTGYHVWVGTGSSGTKKDTNADQAAIRLVKEVPAQQ